jgi:hypothetical protein
MSPRAALLALAAASTIGCADATSPLVTLTDLRLNAADGVLRSGSFSLHVAQPANAAGPGEIKLHSLRLAREDVDAEGAGFAVRAVSGALPGEVAPGDDLVSPLVFTLADESSSTADLGNACTSPQAFSLRGIYFDEATSAFFPIHSGSAWLAAKPLSGATWTERLGDAGLQLESDAAVLADGSSVLVGSTSGTLDFEGKPLSTPGDTKPFLVKLDPSGKPLWSRYFASSFIDPQVRTQGVQLVATTPSGGVVIAGPLDGTLDLGGGTITSAGDTDVFLARFDAQGNHVETRRFGDGLKQTVTALDVDAAGNTVLVGSLVGAIDFGSGLVAPILDPTFTSYYVASLPEAGAPKYAKVPVAVTAPTRFVAGVGSDGVVVMGGSFTGKAFLGAPPIVSSALEAGFVVKLTAGGALAWADATSGAPVLAVAIDQGDVVAVLDLAASAIVAGQQITSGPAGALVLARFDPAGALVSSIPLGASGSADITGLVIDSAGHALLSGHIHAPQSIVGLGAGAGAMGSSFFTEIDRTGARLRIQTFGCESWSIDVAVAHQGSRDPVFVSTFEGAIDLGNGITPPAGASDLLVTRLPAL